MFTALIFMFATLVMTITGSLVLVRMLLDAAERGVVKIALQKGTSPVLVAAPYVSRFARIATVTKALTP